MKPTLGTVTLPPKSNPLPEWMTKELPPRITSPEALEAAWERIHQAQRDIPENAFADSPVSLGEKLLFAGIGACVAFLLVGTLLCFF